MGPFIDSVRFGAITVAGQTIKHDIIITLDGGIQERPKNLSKQRYGTSHTLSLDEVQAVWEEEADTLIIGTGLLGRVRLSGQAQTFLEQHGCTVKLYPTRRAARLWNVSHGRAIGLFHITC